MNEIKKKLPEFIEKLGKDKKALLIVAIGVLGMILILLSELPSQGRESDKMAQNEDVFIYRELEEETEKLLSEVEGAGKVRVMLTYEDDGERIFARNSETRTKTDTESQLSSQYITIEADEGETGLLLKVIYPKVRGVAVVCSGGDDPLVKSEISSLLSALFDIGSNRISIARGAE